MINKIKKTLQSADELEIVKESVKDMVSEIDSAKKTILELQKQFEKRLEENYNAEKLRKEVFLSEVTRIKNTADSFQTELQEFKTLRRHLQTEIISKVSTDIKKELEVYILTIRKKIDELNSMIDSGKEIEDTVKGVKSEIDKFKSIASSIKKEDFALQRHALELKSREKEKIEYVRKIDQLERMVAQMRRRRQ